MPETQSGIFDFEFLEQRLEVEAAKANRKNRLLIGSFSVASNVTGMPLDDIKVTKLLHQYGALSFFDYSAAASHVEIHMNPGQDALTHKDAIFFSGHKFVGGPQTPGKWILKPFRYAASISNKIYYSEKLKEISSIKGDALTAAIHLLWYCCQ